MTITKLKGDIVEADDKIYFVSLNEFKNVATIKLRFKRPKNSQKKFVRWAADFEGLKLPL